MSSGPSSRNEKPRVRLVELHGRDAEIEHDAIGRGGAGDRRPDSRSDPRRVPAGRAPSRPEPRPARWRSDRGRRRSRACRASPGWRAYSRRRRMWRRYKDRRHGRRASRRRGGRAPEYDGAGPPATAVLSLPAIIPVLRAALLPQSGCPSPGLNMRDLPGGLAAFRAKAGGLPDLKYAAEADYFVHEKQYLAGRNRCHGRCGWPRNGRPGRQLRSVTISEG